MNEQRIVQIEKILETLDSLMEELEAIENGEQAAFGKLPAAWKKSENGKMMEDALENLNEALGSLDEVMCYLDCIVSPEE